MRTVITAMAALILTASVALAQGRSAENGAGRPAIGIGSKTMNSCTMDKRKYCASASDYILKECLVKNWNHISSDCQDALATPVDRITPSRGR